MVPSMRTFAIWSLAVLPNSSPASHIQPATMPRPATTRAASRQKVSLRRRRRRSMSSSALMVMGASLASAHDPGKRKSPCGQDHARIPKAPERSLRIRTNARRLAGSEFFRARMADRLPVCLEQMRPVAIMPHALLAQSPKIPYWRASKLSGTAMISQGFANRRRRGIKVRSTETAQASGDRGAIADRAGKQHLG